MGDDLIVFEEHWVTIRWDDALKAICAEWKAYAEGDDFRSPLTHALGLCQRRRASRYLADCRYLGPVTQADQRWLNTDWFPRMSNAGLRFMAVVSPRSSVSRLSVRQVLNRVGDIPLTNSNFDDVEAARAWLRSC